MVVLTFIKYGAIYENNYLLRVAKRAAIAHHASDSPPMRVARTCQYIKKLSTCVVCKQRFKAREYIIRAGIPHLNETWHEQCFDLEFVRPRERHIPSDSRIGRV